MLAPPPRGLAGNSGSAPAIDPFACIRPGQNVMVSWDPLLSVTPADLLAVSMVDDLFFSLYFFFWSGRPTLEFEPKWQKNICHVENK